MRVMGQVQGSWDRCMNWFLLGSFLCESGTSPLTLQALTLP